MTRLEHAECCAFDHIGCDSGYLRLWRHAIRVVVGLLLLIGVMAARVIALGLGLSKSHRRVRSIRLGNN